MKRKFTLMFMAFMLFDQLNAQNRSLKEQALDEFKREHYNEAISLMEKAALESPGDAEVYYYLGWFNHYRAYDSRPLSGYNFSYSQAIFDYLEKAISINPDYGDAKYFYGAECSGNAFLAMQKYDLNSLKYFYKKAGEKGAYPPWLIEFGKNFMNTCSRDAILFTGGNADFDICMYLQLHYQFRTDLTIIPIGNIDRPWYVKFMKDGLEGGFRNIKLNLTDLQIMDIHPFKWDTTTVFIPFSESLKHEFRLDTTLRLEWTIRPDLSSDRMHSKIAGEKEKKRTYLSPQRAILLQIVEDNYRDREIYFSNMSSPYFFGGLDAFFQNCGLTSRLLPFRTEGTDSQFRIPALELMLKPENFIDFASIKNTNIPRISGIVFAYHEAFLNLANHYRKNGMDEDLHKLIGLYKSQLAIGFDEAYERAILQAAEE